VKTLILQAEKNAPKVPLFGYVQYSEVDHKGCPSILSPVHCALTLSRVSDNMQAVMKGDNSYQHTQANVVGLQSFAATCIC